MGKKAPKPYDAVPYTNSHGHTLQPGDAAIALTTSTGRSSLKIGKYLGTRKARSRWSGRGGVNVVMEVQKEGHRLQNDAGELYDEAAESKLLGPYPRYPTAPYYSPEYKTQYAEYNRQCNERNVKQQELRKGYKYVKYTFMGTTTLQNNNVYPGDIALRDVVL